MSVGKAACGIAMATLILVSGCISPPRRHADTDETEAKMSAPAAFLLPRPYSKIRLEVYAAPGTAPPASMIEAMQSEIARATGKMTQSVQVVPIVGEDGNPHGWREVDLHRIATAHSSEGLGSNEFGRNSTAILEAYFLNGTYTTSSGSQAGGVAYEGRIFMFISHTRISDHEFTQGEVTLSTALQEVGHVFGLVNCGIPMVHPREATTAPPCHSSNEHTVMTYGTEVVQDRIWLTAIPYPTQFDDDDLADIAAFQAKASIR